MQIALDANSFTRFAAEFPEKDTKRGRITVGTAQDLGEYEEFKEEFENEVKIANGILAVGVESFEEFVHRYRQVAGKNPLMGYLRDIWDEYWADYHENVEEARATGN